jgi:hypothetical protein
MFLWQTWKSDCHGGNQAGAHDTDSGKRRIDFRMGWSPIRIQSTWRSVGDRTPNFHSLRQFRRLPHLVYLTPLRCYHQSMTKRMPPEVLEYLKGLGQQYGSQGGKKAAKNMTAEERLARAKIASDAAARKRTAARLAREASLKQAKKAAR